MEHTIKVQHATLQTGTRMMYRTVGAGEPVLLLHGFPQTGACWSDVAIRLAEDHTVIFPDLRGLGGTSGPDRGRFDKLTLAGEVGELMADQLGFSSYHCVGHDWGGVVATSLAALEPDRVTTLTVVDVVVPSDSAPDMSQGGNRWHHAFHRVAELPEALVRGREDIYLNWFFDHFGLSKDAVSPRHRAEYVRAYSRPGSMSAAFEYYRAADTDRALLTNVLGERPLQMPVLAVGGSGAWGRGHEVRDSLTPLTRGDVSEVLINDAGHWVPEESPDALAMALRTHFASALSDL